MGGYVQFSIDPTDWRTSFIFLDQNVDGVRM